METLGNMFFRKRSLTLQLIRNASSLLQTQGFINGSWVDASDCKMFPVKNPANGRCIAEVADMPIDDMKTAIKSANEAFYAPEWFGLTAVARSNLLKKWYELLCKNGNEIASIMTAESGKPLSDSFAEVNYGNSFIEWFAEETRRVYGAVIPSPQVNRQIIVVKEPIGVAGLITPWNFPLAMITRKVGAALAAGCTVVIKPSEETPLTALAAVKLSEQAGFPKGVINIVPTMKAKAVGDLFCECREVRVISFTGSTAVGKMLYRGCADRVKRLALELGGNAPFIVFDSADVDRTVACAIAGKFRNSGQTCVSPNRFFVQKGIYEKFINLLKKKIAALKMGPGDKKGVQIGPVINKKQLNRVCSLVEDAKCQNAKVIQGGKIRTDIGELFYEPTIITNVNTSMNIYIEEIFGPVVSVIKFNTEEEAIDMANESHGTLASYIYSTKVQQIFRVARKVHTGVVGINEGLVTTAEAPFGGIKESGIGREGSHHGIDEYVDVKYICHGGLKY